MATNSEYFCMCLMEPPVEAVTETLSPDDLKASARPLAAILKSAMWGQGAKISCRFLEGSPALQARVMAVAREWEKFANLTLEFRTSGPTSIRIAFRPGKGSWSYIGTVCRRIHEPKETMNYGWLTDHSSDDEVRRVVLHEFGHAIGLIHEHQNPLHGIAWNKPAVIHDLSGPPNSWDLDKINTNMFVHYLVSDVIATPVDGKSIMMYPIPKAWTLDGFSAGLNSELSPSDKQLVAAAYPK